MTAVDTTGLEAILRRDRLVVIAGLAIVIGIAWVWLLLGPGSLFHGESASDAMDMAPMSPAPMSSAQTGAATGMAGMTGMARMTGMAGMTGMSDMVMQPAIWSPAYAGLMLTMWWVMMVAMMLPGATPAVLLFARINRKERLADRPYVPTGLFAAGYLAVWGGFSALATALQWKLQGVGLVSSMMTTTSVWLSSAILVAAGVWQLTPIKSICLRHCRSPISFLAQRWRPGRMGAFRLGIDHGAYCLGCCWFLMGLLFFGGVMNLFWISGLAAFILLEKTLPMGHWFGRFAGVGLIALALRLFTMSS